MSTKTMAEVLAEHQQSYTFSCGLENECYCGHELDGETIAEHQAGMLKVAGFRAMTMVELAYRDRPESMEAARAKVLADRKESQARAARAVADRVGKRYARLHQMLRDELQAQAWREGYDAGWDDGRDEDGKTPNPYGRLYGQPDGFAETFAERMARESTEAKLAKHHPAQIPADHLIDEME